MIRAVTGRETRLFRIPYGDPDDNVLAVPRAQQLGYAVVDYDIDTSDWAGAGSLAAISFLYVTLALASQWRQDRVHSAHGPPTPLLVSVALPAYNEEKVLAKTLTALARTSYPAFEVVAVDDGSADDTWGVLTAFASVWPRLRIFRQVPNQGKAAALTSPSPRPGAR